jgi:putative hydrolase of the HAD superfamily
MAKIRATFWDCGGVLLTNGWDEHARERVAKHFGLNFDEFEKRHHPANDLWERGRIDVHEYLRETVFYVARPFSEDEFFARMRDVSQVLHPGMIEFLGAMRAQGSRDTTTYMLSNESRELMAYRIPRFGLAGLFDAYLVSAYMGLRKPEAAFFQCALDVSQCQPDECVFVDDREENLEGARKLGIQGIRLTSPEQVIAELRRLGITADRAA